MYRNNRLGKAITGLVVLACGTVAGPTAMALPGVAVTASPGVATAGPGGRADVNGDGIGDIVVASGSHLGAVPDPNAPNELGGSVYVIPGGSGALPGARPSLTHQNSPDVLDNPEQSDTFGRVLATGDFNGDRLADVAIGNPNESLGGSGQLAAAGAVTVLYGQTSRPYLGIVPNGLAMLHQGVPGVPGETEAGDQYGAALASGDFNGDGFADLAVGSPGEAIGTKAEAGGICVYYGSSNGLTVSRIQDFTQDTAGVVGDSEAFDRFGWSLAAGDVTGDGVDDLAILAQGEKVAGEPVDNAGAVWLLNGSTAGLTTTGASHVNVSNTGTTHNLRTVTIARLHGGSNADVVLYADEKAGAPRMSGALVVLRGGSDGIRAGGVHQSRVSVVNQSTSAVLDSAESDDLFGASLAAGDINGDGADDLAVGVPGEGRAAGAGQGAVHLFLGGPNGLLTAPDFLFDEGHPLVNAVPQGAENFGNGLRVLDVTGDALPELLVTAPREDGDFSFGALFVVGVAKQGETLTVTSSALLNKATLGGISPWGPATPIAGGTLSLGPGGVTG
jgi:FG-GAP repeat